jgi:hypothetical protein
MTEKVKRLKVCRSPHGYILNAEQSDIVEYISTTMTGEEEEILQALVKRAGELYPSTRMSNGIMELHGISDLPPITERRLADGEVIQGEVFVRTKLIMGRRSEMHHCYLGACSAEPVGEYPKATWPEDPDDERPLFHRCCIHDSITDEEELRQWAKRATEEMEEAAQREHGLH